MRITEVRIKLTADTDDRLQAFCSVTFDDWFVVRDLKIIDGPRGPFVAMPSRKLTDRCSCGTKNHLRARFCNECGQKLNQMRARRDQRGKSRLHMDIAHPINSECREEMHDTILDRYQEEVKASKEPGYRPVSLGEDYDDEEVFRGRSPRERPNEHGQPDEQGQEGEEACEF